MTDAVVHPGTGELLDDLTVVPAATLADAHAAITRQQDALKLARLRLEEELQRRLEVRGLRMDLFGDYEVAIEGGRRRVWDPDDTEAALRDLIDAGTLHAAELTEVVKREIKVNGSNILRVLARLQGPAKARLEACYEWRDTPTRVRVTRSISLIPEENE